MTDEEEDEAAARIIDERRDEPTVDGEEVLQRLGL